MTKVLVTGGAGFMGRWISRELLSRQCDVWVLDNLSNSSPVNVEEFRDNLGGFIVGDLKDRKLLSDLFRKRFDVCIHCAAAINVQESIDHPEKCFQDNVNGTFFLLEECRKVGTRMVFVSSALVYQTAKDKESISEDHPLQASCAYAASKITGENFTMAYHWTYGLPVVILRPFSIYGPWQKSDSEGGVVSIFIGQALRNQPLTIYGTGEQSRDFFFVEDCATFVAEAAFSEVVNGQVLNAGSGNETRIRDLARMIAGNLGSLKFVEHHHPHAEIMHMRTNAEKAKKFLGWESRTSLEEGLRKTRQWLAAQMRI